MSGEALIRLLPTGIDLAVQKSVDDGAVTAGDPSFYLGLCANGAALRKAVLRVSP